MFTGIVEEIGKVISAQPDRLSISGSRVLEGSEPGCSIAVYGVCLTVTALTSNSFTTDIMPETIKRTNLRILMADDKVNLERPMALGGRLGGHLVQGHIDDTGRITSIIWQNGAKLFRFEAATPVMRYVVEKGFIAVDGISLTVVARDARSFQVSVVDYTEKNTTLGGHSVGDLVNLEVDIIAKYVEQLAQTQGGGITTEFLQEHGFLVH
ncbi:MAG: riboflavin synthase [Chloroflexi bacterium]|nr:riboflavin synthase [Chloroflexota bacterium]